MSDPVHMREQSDEPLQITVERARPDAVVVRLVGDLDLLTAPVLHDRLWPLLDERDQTVIADLSGLAFLGSSGLSELVAAKDVAGRNGTRILLVAGARAVLRPLEVTGLHTLFPIFDSVPAALADL